MDKVFNSTLLVACFLIPSLADANDWSIGLLAGQSNTNIPFVDDCIVGIASESPPSVIPQSTCSSDETGFTIGLSASYQLSNNFALEAGYLDLGETEFRFEVDTIGERFTGSLLTKSEVLYFAGVASIDLTDRWSLSGRLSYYKLESEETQTLDSVTSSPFRSRDENDLSAGVSVSYKLSSNWAAELRYDDFDIDVYTVGINYTFGN